MAAWTAEVSALAVVAATRPHAAYCAFTHGMIGRWIYVMRTVPNIGPLFQPLEDAIRLQFIPAFTGHASRCCLSLVALQLVVLVLLILQLLLTFSMMHLPKLLFL